MIENLVHCKRVWNTLRRQSMQLESIYVMPESMRQLDDKGG